MCIRDRPREAIIAEDDVIKSKPSIDITIVPREIITIYKTKKLIMLVISSDDNDLPLIFIGITALG